MDWHALTTQYEDTQVISDSVWKNMVELLSAGINPGSAKLFIQSMVPEHAELHLLLSMHTPISWLERVPTYKDQQEKLNEDFKKLQEQMEKTEQKNEELEQPKELGDYQEQMEKMEQLLTLNHLKMRSFKT